MYEIPDTSESLIERVKNPTDSVAWNEFLAVYRPVVYRLARARGLQDSDAEDLTQHVFLAVAGAIEKWQPSPDKPPFRAWLFRITRNAIVNAVSRRHPTPGSGSTSVWELLQQHPAVDEATTADFVRESRMEAFRWAARQIQAEFRETTWSLFWETTVEGRTVEQTATKHNRTTGAVYLARYRVLRRLREIVQEWVPFTEDSL